jgi:serine protease Do
MCEFLSGGNMKNETNVKKQQKKELFKTLLTVLIAVAAGFFGGYFGSQNSIVSGGDSTSTRQIIEGENNLINTIAKDVSPSVVSVNVTSTSTGTDYFGFGQTFENESAGTGVIISKDGLIITNRHVIPSGTTKVTVTLSDGTEIEAEVVGRTNESDPLDIGFLQLQNPEDYDLKAVNIGDSDAVQVGDRVVAIGNALGQFQNTVTSGIISGFGRDIEAFDGGGLETLQNLFQTDAAINSGNSGGPLVNSASEVIGINVATASAENISFAIPINDVKGLIDIVLDTGRLERPYLGVRYVPLDDDIARNLELDINHGAYIPEGTPNRPAILPGSPAEKAGLKEKDVIIEIEGTKLDDKNGLVGILGRKRVGEAVEIKVIRDGEELSLTAVLEAAPEL